MVGSQISGTGPMRALSETAATEYDRPRAASWPCKIARKSSPAGAPVPTGVQRETSWSPIRSGRAASISAASAPARAGKFVNWTVPQMVVVAMTNSVGVVAVTAGVRLEPR